MSPNRLAAETSPYLRQHADNPVDWYPWGPEALARARAEDKPILLSIGYAACHWCHVMAHESFEDPGTAELMNRHFVCVKVDREERPDVDAIYMDAVQALTGHGGWPLTAFLTPEGEPFYAGTYFPKEDRGGLPAFRRVLEAIAEVWDSRRDEVRAQAGRVVEAISRAGTLRPSADPLSEEVPRAAVRALRASFDPVFGGFGGPPKFPQPMTLEFLLRRHLRGEPEVLPLVERTLEAMASGGIFDQVGGGFHRYATDARWHVPHFEKMLSDNAQLARLYVRAWQVTRGERWREVASRALEYLLRELRQPAGGFSSSQDADSEGTEGAFYVWRWEELVEVAGEPVARALGARPEGNWEGANVLWLPRPIEEVAAELGATPTELAAELAAARTRLFERREGRVRPAVDDKVVAAWNGLAISALAEAGRALGEARYVEAAEAAANFVLEVLRLPDGRLARSWREGRVGPPGFADDHALLAEACLALYETTWDPRWLEEALGLAGALLERFHDPERGGFFQAATDAEPLIVRPKELIDHATPSGSSAAAEVLLRLSHLTGEEAYERAAVSALRLVRDLMAQAPTGFAHALCALELSLGPVREVAIVGDPADPGTRALVDEVLVRRYLPNHVLAVAPPGGRGTPALLRDRTALEGRPTAYVCERFTCRLPVTDPAALAAQLEAGSQ